MPFAGVLSRRSREVVTGTIAVLLVTAVVYVGVRAANGDFAPSYDLVATFDAAGQGLISESDVKIHGVNIGKVRSVELDAGRALVTMRIDADEDVPEAATATIRAKTLFGEKFVDIDPGEFETTGPFLSDGERIAQTTGGFELEQILADAHPILEAVDPEDLAVILSALAEAGRDLGATVNRSIANFAAVADVQARHDADTQQFLDDLALLSEELADRGDDLVGMATDLNVALPPLNERGDKLTTVLDEAARLAADLADVLEANRPLLEKGVTKGGRVLQTLYDQRGQLPGLVRGLRYFLQVLAEVGRIELGDGTRLAAIKGILGGGSPCGRTTVGCTTYAGPPAGAASIARAPAEPLALPAPIRGPDALISLIEGTLR